MKRAEPRENRYRHTWHSVIGEVIGLIASSFRSTEAERNGRFLPFDPCPSSFKRRPRTTA